MFQHRENANLLKPAIPIIRKLWESDDDTLQDRANDIMTSLGASSGDILGDDVNILIEQYLNGEQPNLASMTSTLLQNKMFKLNHNDVSERVVAL